ncbi:pentatricopeptide repeat-containing protein At4g28010-like isoform X2 [Salvia hispanica]|uniref:pentatricopeptide repeat-containing protein At4g28010-like isoform X2 n=1 Tax=Salvia hispanica TaxID=49212 RepID=UPI002008F155|nr:pentatricopeptide repeat-containing protein At4g28010-like isoform X2 [Salvia hispanica]
MGVVPSGPSSDLLLQTLVKNRKHNLALSIYKKMVCSGALPRYLSLSALVECLVHLSMPQLALGAIGLMLKQGYTINLYIANVVLNGLCCNGFVVDAEEFLGEMDRNHVSPDIVSFNTLIKGLHQEKRLDEAMSMKRRMESANIAPNLITYNILMDAHFVEDRVDGAMMLLEEMKMKGLEPDVFFYDTLINGFCRKEGESKGSEALVQ